MPSECKRASDAPEVSDEELAKLAQRGDLDSLNSLFAKHWSALQWRAQWLYPSAWEDVLQDSCVIAADKFTAFGPPYNFRAWIGQILENVSRNIKKTDKNRGPVGPDSGNQDIGDVWRKQTAADQLDLSQLLKLLEHDLEALDAESQKIGRFMLAFFAKDEQWPSKREIERELCIPASTALRCREKVIDAWKRDCQAYGFWPLV
jgi:DNA-directed RNA polymerase specialized sigma24 family protein